MLMLSVQEPHVENHCSRGTTVNHATPSPLLFESPLPLPPPSLWAENCSSHFSNTEVTRLEIPHLYPYSTHISLPQSSLPSSAIAEGVPRLLSEANSSSYILAQFTS